MGVLAVAPSIPFTGGALLGDRIRRESHTSDPGVFVRSMASRQSHGGLARAAIDAVAAALRETPTLLLCANPVCVPCCATRELVLKQ